ncbi:MULTISPECIES: restriction endonuclease subunit S [Methanobacterium]|uniref:Restriction endonuclease subunit S n=1 Tax=Methanobacterium veterum TaxID=408577 RepID=A0A9E5DJS1_9EURY|nr:MULTISPECIES: restriction endonuclease subunit S [Methanobacterium]MCZ3366537.1 restriction endonuclease subunit S [Methanobacterium veterum]MCZ3371754.1 restriction endonuclease subunit S [Methanobacterium veterum]
MECKTTTIGAIPVDWDLKRVKDIFDVKTGTTPSTKKQEYWEDGTITWITPADMSKLDGISIKDSNRKVTKKALKENNLNLIPKKSIILSTRAPVGYVALNIEESTFNQGCKGLVPKNPDTTDTLFYSYYLLSKNNRLQQLSGGSTFKELAKDTLMKFDLPVPSIHEQRKIAEILSVTDQAIQKSDEIITKTERFKKGIMQKLLTRGIGHNEYKSTKIGEIPVDWNLVSLMEIADNESDIVAGPFGSNLKVSDYTKEGVPIIRLQNIERNQFVNKDIKFTSQEKAKELKYHSFKAGDIVLAKLGDPIGKTCLVPSFLKEGLIVADVVRIRPSSKKANKIFIEYVLNSVAVSNQFKMETIGSTRPRVNLSQVRKLKIPLPRLNEQEKIGEILLNVDKKLEFENKRKLKFEKVKKGLMNDFLTGHKRVKLDT